MLKIGKMTDYATVILGRMAADGDGLHAATALAEATRIALPTVSKLLKQLQRAGLVHSVRGLRGGYQLARPAAEITAVQILDAVEGPVVLTDCSAGEGHCDIESHCHVGTSWQRLNLAIRRSLNDVSLAQLAGLEQRVPQLARPQEFHVAVATIGSRR
ncbi:MAG: SUF system Fe-S cluster assembly regulator [Steroidobacteraceae bacterium]